MKHINLKLSVLFWLVASSIMAITLPTSSYEMFPISDDTEQAYSLVSGSTIKNHSTLTASNDYGCRKEEVEEIGTTCSDCCLQAIGCSPQDYACIRANQQSYVECVGACQTPHLGSLDGFTLSFMCIILAYASFMVYRHRKVHANEGIA